LKHARRNRDRWGRDENVEVEVGRGEWRYEGEERIEDRRGRRRSRGRGEEHAAQVVYKGK